MHFIALMLSLYLFANTTCEHDEKNFRCVEYVSNYDGDTITFNIPNVHSLIGNKISIRLRGVDTAEIRTKNFCEKEKARAAKRLVENLLKRAKRIDLENIQRGKYFRIIADVKLDGNSLSEYLLKNQLAYVYDGKTKLSKDWCDVKRLPASE